MLLLAGLQFNFQYIGQQTKNQRTRTLPSQKQESRANVRQSNVVVVGGKRKKMGLMIAKGVEKEEGGGMRIGLDRMESGLN